MDVRYQKDIDEYMIHELDGTESEWGFPKSKLGANAVLAVSMAVARAGADAFGMKLYEYIRELKDGNLDPAKVNPQAARSKKYKMPVPMMNVINGGQHAGNALPMQEFMIAPTGASSFSEALQIGAETYHSLKAVVKSRYGKDAAAVGDEGGFAPNIQENDEGLSCLMDAIKDAGHDGKVKLAMDIAAAEFYVAEDKTYNLGFKIDNPDPSLIKSQDEMMEFYDDITSRYPIVSIEDPFDQDDWDAYSVMVARFGDKVQIVGDDLLVTNPKRIEYCIEQKAANALLLKVNQIGSISEAITASLDSVAQGWGVMVSHRSGETEDTFIADLCVGLGTGQIKTGAPCRSERNAKYNQLMRIEEELGKRCSYPGPKFRFPQKRTAKVVMVRHGESTWNALNLFTGWQDVELSETGKKEAAAAGVTLAEGKWRFDSVHTSELQRAQNTLNAIKEALGGKGGGGFRRIQKTWRLNERHYGNLTGLDKAETAAKFGEDQVKIWRRSFDV